MTNMGAQLEKYNALKDIYFETGTYGDLIVFTVRTENGIVRDKYDSMKIRNQTESLPSTKIISMNAFPIINDPNARQLEKAGLREVSQVLIYTPMYSWMLEYPDETAEQILGNIDLTRLSLDMHGKTYNLKEKSLLSGFLDTYLYISMGINEI